MRLLFCCEYYHPSRGGVQEVMRQLAERMVQYGHKVTIATTKMPERDFESLNGVNIEEFAVHGNLATGLYGETARYEAFLRSFPADAIMIKAAQQWTFDAAWPVLDQVKARKVFIPCGFSGLYNPQYKTYFSELPPVLAKFDQLIFYAEHYRDIDFARAHGLANTILIPNGASDIEFAVPPDDEFRATLGIAADEFVLLTVGTPVNAKGHTEVAAAFAALETSGRPMTLILNGQWPLLPAQTPVTSDGGTPPQPLAPVRPLGALDRILRITRRGQDVLRRDGFAKLVKRGTTSVSYRSLGLARKTGRGFINSVLVATYHARQFGHRLLPTIPVPEQPQIPAAEKTIDDWIADAAKQPRKRVLKTHLSRPHTIQAFLTADLFVFASNIEYSPLVLFEAGAAGLPYLTVPVGNAEEIVRWTGGGAICPAAKDDFGSTRVDPIILADHIARLVADDALRQTLSANGRDAWQTTYNWGTIAKRYEAILAGPT
jgi:glycosyltransferase involved in cell wall biosynthesis